MSDHINMHEESSYDAAPIKNRKRAQRRIVVSSDDESTDCQLSRKQRQVWIASYEEIPNISDNDKKVLRLETMNGFIIGVYNSLDSAKSACINYIAQELNHPEVDSHDIDWEDDGWFCDDLLDELDPFRKVYITKFALKRD